MPGQAEKVDQHAPVQTTSKDLGMVLLGSVANTIDVPIVANRMGSMIQFQTWGGRHRQTMV